VERNIDDLRRYVSCGRFVERNIRSQTENDIEFQAKTELFTAVLFVNRHAAQRHFFSMVLTD
jgi:hypothetical protein